MSMKRKRILWSVLTVVSVTASALTFSVVRKSRAAIARDTSATRARTSTASDNAPKASATPMTIQASGPVQMVRFTVYDEGIKPSVAYASPGLVAIYLDDKSTHTAALLIANDQHPIGTISRQIGKLRGHSTVTLASGQYTIYEANRRTNAATLIIAQ